MKPIATVTTGNTTVEMREKMTLYFDAGAEEVWLCDLAGNISFHAPAGPPPLTRSRVCPEFPPRIVLR